MTNNPPLKISDTYTTAFTSVTALADERWTLANNDPFTSMAFLTALEECGAVAPDTGWAPKHLLLKDANERSVAFMPLYLKGHSMGEYVFDHAWAAAFDNAGGQYYPKLLSAVPFTPVAGPRIIVQDGYDKDQAEALLIKAAKGIAANSGLSSLHINFVSEEFAKTHEAPDLFIRTDQQFHWYNRGYASFGEFLETLNSRKRKQIRRERKAAMASDITITQIHGRDISEAQWDAFYGFYLDTGMRKWGQPYLNREFFSLIGKSMPDNLMLVMCERAGKPIAAALNFIGPDALYGRWWGASEHHPFLHFEACYYQAIDYAIEHKLARVEAGAQGPHKVARGYEPTTTWSLHHLPDPNFSEAIERYLRRERKQVKLESDYLSDHLPFKTLD